MNNLTHVIVSVRMITMEYSDIGTHDLRFVFHDVTTTIINYEDDEAARDSMYRRIRNQADL